MKKIRVLVMGGRIVPNIIGILNAFPLPDKIEVIVSKDTPKKPQELKKALDLTLDSIKIEMGEEIVASAYEYEEIYKSCQQICQKYLDSEITFDITSAPTIMCLAVYDFAKKYNQKVLYVDTANGYLRFIPPECQTPIKIKLTVEQYLTCYLRKACKTFDFAKLSVSKSNALALADFLAFSGKVGKIALDKFRQWSQGKEKRTIPFSKTGNVTDDEYKIFQKIQEFGFITNLKRNKENHISYTIISDHDHKFVEGKWLETYLWQAAKELKDNSNSLFDDVQFSLEIPTEEGSPKEIDFAAIRKGILIIASCKTAKKLETKFLEELHSVADMIGGKYVTKLFVTNFIPTDDNSAINLQNFKNQAYGRQIVVISGEELKNIQEILKKEVLNPTYRRI